VKGEQLVFDAAGVETSGGFSLSVVVPRGDLLALAFGIDGTKLDLDRFKGWEKNLLSIEEIKGGGEFRLAEGTLSVRGFRVAGGKIEIRANARVTDKGAFGKVLASYGAPSVGIELRGQERALHVLRPEHWFESR